MSALATLANWLDPQRTSVIDVARAAQAERAQQRAAATSPIAFDPYSGSDFGPGIGNQPAAEDLLREARGIFDAGQRAIANRIASLVPEVVTERRQGDGTMLEDVVDNHPLQQLLNNPHPNITQNMLFRLGAQWVTGVGECHWLKVGSALGITVELHPIPPTKVVSVWRAGVISHYVVTDGKGVRHSIPQDEIVHIYFPDPERFWGAEGYLGPMGITADSSKFAGEHMREFYRHDASPKVVLELDEVMKPDVKEAFYAEYRASFDSRTGSKRGLPVSIAGGKLVQMAMQSGADIVPLIKHWDDQQLLALGVPRSVLGKVESGDRSSAEVNQYVFDRYTVKPIADLFEDALTYQLAKDFDPSLRVRFQPFVSADKEFELKKQAQRLTLKLSSINSELEAEGADTVPWGDLPVGTFTDTPYDPSAIDDDLPDDDEDALGDRVRSAERDPNERTNLVRAEWQRQVQREKTYVPGFTKRVRHVLRAQRRSVLERLRASQPRTRITADDLFTEEEWREIFEETVEPARVAAYTAIVESTLETLDGVTEFSFTETQAAVLRRQGAELVTNVNRTTKRMLAEALAEATEAGESVDQIASRIDTVFKTRRKQARTIARTEVLKASQEAQITAFEVSEVVERKQWNTSLDSAVRESHAPVNGQGRDLREPFELADGELADAPGIGAHGATLSAGNSINCRCFLTPVIL
ncbi:MAG TPA: phage portal protein [Gammaproteobacteria bacterium]|nr:phage portal protein [Gammaproteobacteria bacterium]